MGALLIEVGQAVQRVRRRGVEAEVNTNQNQWGLRQRYGGKYDDEK